MFKQASASTRSRLKPAQIGCRLAHVDLWEREVGEGIKTALTLEDDIDLDLNLRGIFENLSRQVRASKYLSDEYSREQDVQPYGRSPFWPCCSCILKLGLPPTVIQRG